MRCFLLVEGHIRAAEDLEPASDQCLIEQAHRHFARRSKAEHFDGFEVWDHARQVYSWPVELGASGSGNRS